MRPSRLELSALGYITPKPDMSSRLAIFDKATTTRFFINGKAFFKLEMKS